MKNEMGGACSKHGSEETCTQGFGGKMWGKEYWEYVGMDLRIILKWTFSKMLEMDWIYLAKVRDK